MTHVTCRLTAKNRDQLQDPTLGNRVRATFNKARSSIVIADVTVSLRVRVRVWLQRTLPIVNLGSRGPQSLTPCSVYLLLSYHGLYLMICLITSYTI